jgi:TPR repeat protein
LTAAANQNVAKAQSKLGSMYLAGYGVQKDALEARKWFAAAAAQGDEEAQAHLGFMYNHGVGVGVDKRKAFEFVLLLPSLCSWFSASPLPLS